MSLMPHGYEGQEERWQSPETPRGFKHIFHAVGLSFLSLRNDTAPVSSASRQLQSNSICMTQEFWIILKLQDL